MMKKVLILFSIVAIIAAVAYITNIFIKRNKVDYYIPGLDDYNSGDIDETQEDLDNMYFPDEEDEFYEEDLEGFDYSKIERTYKGKLKEAQEIYNKVALGNSLDDIKSALGEPNRIDKDEENPDFVSVSYTSPDEKYEVNFCLTNDKVTEKNLFLLTSVKNDLFLSSELQTEIDDLNSLVEEIKEGMSFDNIVNVLGNKYYEVSEDDDFGKWFSWCDKLEQIISIAFKDGNAIKIIF